VDHNDEEDDVEDDVKDERTAQTTDTVRQTDGMSMAKAKIGDWMAKANGLRCGVDDVEVERDGKSTKK